MAVASVGPGEPGPSAGRGDQGEGPRKCGGRSRHGRPSAAPGKTPSGTQAYPRNVSSVDGVFYQNSTTRIPAIADGTSNTLLMGERSHVDPVFRADRTWGGPNLGSYGWWAYPN